MDYPYELSVKEVHDILTKYWPDLQDGLTPGTGCSVNSVKPIMVSEMEYLYFPSIDVLEQVLDRLEVWKRSYQVNAWDCDNFAQAAKAAVLWDCIDLYGVKKQPAFGVVRGSSVYGSSSCHAVNIALVSDPKSYYGQWNEWSDEPIPFLIEPMLEMAYRPAGRDKDTITFISI